MWKVNHGKPNPECVREAPQEEWHRALDRVGCEGVEGAIRTRASVAGVQGRLWAPGGLLNLPSLYQAGAGGGALRAHRYDGLIRQRESINEPLSNPEARGAPARVWDSSDYGVAGDHRGEAVMIIDPREEALRIMRRFLSRAAESERDGDHDRAVFFGWLAAGWSAVADRQPERELA